MTDVPADQARPSRGAWLVWGLALLTYGVAVFHRSSLGVSGLVAQHRFGASAAVLSLFSVLQLAVYAAMQVPVGVLLDRLGSRRLMATGAFVMAAGQFLLAQADSVPAALTARVLVGTGDAMTFISVLRLVPVWFPPRRVPVLTQVTGIVGQLGQVAAAYPLVALLSHAGWTTSFDVAAAVGVGVGLLVVLFLRDLPAGHPPPPAPPDLAQVRSNVRDAWQEPGTRLGLWTHFTTQFSGTVFALLWGFPFLVVGEGRSPGEAGLLLSLLVVVGMGVGPLLGSLTGRWPLRRSNLVFAIVGASALMWSVVLLWPGRAPLWLLLLLVLVLASNGPGSMVAFDFARTENPTSRLGSATGIVNVGGFVASLCTILLIGTVLDLLAPAGAGSYSLGDFRLALCVQYLFWGVGLLGVARSRIAVRRGYAERRGVELDPLYRAVARRARSARGA